MHRALQVEPSERASERYAKRVNPEWVRLLDWLQMNVRYERCVGTELFTDDGRRILDFLSGYCVHNIGHNHPAVVPALQNELERCGPAMIQTHVADLAGELADKLCDRARGTFREGLLLLFRKRGRGSGRQVRPGSYGARGHTLRRTCVPRLDLRGAVPDERRVLERRIWTASPGNFGDPPSGVSEHSNAN